MLYLFTVDVIFYQVMLYNAQTTNVTFDGKKNEIYNK